MSATLSQGGLRQSTLRRLGPLPAVRSSNEPLASGAQRLGYRLAVFSVFLQFVISPNVLMLMGINYDMPGGNPLLKLHPATYIAALAACLALCGPRPAGSALTRLFRTEPGLALYLLLIPLCAAWSIFWVGFSGSGVYIETYISAGLVALALMHGTDRQHRILAWLVIAICVFDVGMSVLETLKQTHFIPMQKFEGVIPDDRDDFRGAALFTHPLTAALVTALAIFLLLGMQMNALLRAALFGVLAVGLLSYSGRAATGTTILLLAGGTIVAVTRGILYRRLSGGLIAALAAGALLLVPMLVVVASGTAIGDRLLSHLYADDSASVRSIQWLVLNHLNVTNVLFGVTPARLNTIKFEIGLGAADTDIENFWLLMFLDLGIIGFGVWLVAMGLFVAWLGRRAASPYGWMILVAFIIIDSTSNSLGRKTADLVFLVAIMFGLSGYRHVGAAAVPAARTLLQRFARRRFPATAPGQRVLARVLPSRSSNAPMAGLKQ
jgi:hypothetical protein